ncbi:MAG: ABC transporter permease [Chloroflexi bacterium OLB15]|nr:MAG: ABC transporter permease [Chloroflexi bacterium OLB15]
MTANATIPKLQTEDLPNSPRKSHGVFVETLINLKRNRSAMIGLAIISFMFMLAILAPTIAPYDPLQPMLNRDDHRGLGRLPGRAPCIHLLGCPADEPQHIMGLDLNGRDMFSRVLWGARYSLVVGIISVAIGVSIGALSGMISGYAGGWVDAIIMRLMDILLAFPALILAIAIVSFAGPSLENALLAIAIVSIPVYARLARASVLSVKEMEFVTATRALGAGHPRLLFGQIMPNALTPLIVQGTLGIGSVVLETAALSFIGLGAQPPTPEWGAILSEGRNYVFTSPHLVFFPGIMIMITVLGFNLLGDGLRDAMDPRLNRN